jgi:hypothetical protein
MLTLGSYFFLVIGSLEWTVSWAQSKHWVRCYFHKSDVFRFSIYTKHSLSIQDSSFINQFHVPPLFLDLTRVSELVIHPPTC